MSFDENPNLNEFRRATQEIYDSLLPLCQENYSRDVLTAFEMRKVGKGNCFTHAEATTLELLGSAVIKSAGISVTLAPRRTNYHTGSIAFGHNDEVAVLDLIEGEPLYPKLDDATKVVGEGVLDGSRWFYVFKDASGNKQVAPVYPDDDSFDWPAGSSRHAVYMPPSIGITAIHSIAKLGGINRLFEAESNLLIPTLPNN